MQADQALPGSAGELHVPRERRKLFMALLALFGGWTLLLVVLNLAS